METKPCKYCDPPTIKTLDAFYNRKASPDGKSNKCRDCERRDHKKYYRKKRTKAVHRKSNLKILYNLTTDQYFKMYEEQKGCCAICGGWRPMLLVDHNHETGLVRELLCSGCNHGLGRFKDDPTIVANALHYLERHERRNQEVT
jgi:hypothetical protein